jgi:hypothetical protein
MTAARGIAAIALVCGSVVWARPAAAALIEFTLGAEPEVQLLSYQLNSHPQSLIVDAQLDHTTSMWVHDAAIGAHFQSAVLTETAGRTVLT